MPTAFPWVPLTRWRRDDGAGRWLVEVRTPEPHPGWPILVAVHGRGATPREAWADLVAHLDWWNRDRRAEMERSRNAGARKYVLRKNQGQAGPVGRSGGPSSSQEKMDDELTDASGAGLRACAQR